MPEVNQSRIWVAATGAGAAAWLAVATLAAGSTHADDVLRYRIIFPLTLTGQEQLEKVDLTVVCGHIDIVSIPDMWNLRVERAVSGSEKLIASAGLGAAALGKGYISRFNGKIVVTIAPPTDCLDLTGELVVLGENGYRTVKLTKRDLHRIK